MFSWRFLVSMFKAICFYQRLLLVPDVWQVQPMTFLSSVEIPRHLFSSKTARQASISNEFISMLFNECPCRALLWRVKTPHKLWLFCDGCDAIKPQEGWSPCFNNEIPPRPNKKTHLYCGIFGPGRVTVCSWPLVLFCSRCTQMIHHQCLRI